MIIEGLDFYLNYLVNGAVVFTFIALAFAIASLKERK
jgi:hypothetical protein